MVSPQVRLANEIAAQFPHQPPDQAAAAIARHIRQFWDPRMQADLLHHAAATPGQLDRLVLAAMRELEPCLRFTATAERSHNGSWEARWVEVDARGEPRRRCLDGFQTEEGARRFAAQAEEAASATRR
jgi:formate dehydrogenase subunit delta